VDRVVRPDESLPSRPSPTLRGKSEIVDDPRLTRPLPWVVAFELDNPKQLLSAIRGFSIMALFAAVLVFAPAMYVGSLIRWRTWSLRTFFLAPALVGLALVVLSIPLPEESGLNRSWISRFFMGIFMLPAVLLVYAAIQTLRRRRWRRLLVWSLATVLMTAALMALSLGLDRVRNSDSLAYSWEGWYWLWFLGVYLTGWLLIPAMLAEWTVRAVLRRRERQRDG
jgi:hypothetical protein